MSKMVFDWFVDVRHPLGKCKPLPLSRRIIQARAKPVASELGFADFNAPNASEVVKDSILKSVKDFLWTLPIARNCDISMLPLIRCAQKFRGNWKLNSAFICNWSI
jgi:hypothetical protein